MRTPSHRPTRTGPTAVRATAGLPSVPAPVISASDTTTASAAAIWTQSLISCLCVAPRDPSQPCVSRSKTMTRFTSTSTVKFTEYAKT